MADEKVVVKPIETKPTEFKNLQGKTIDPKIGPKPITQIIPDGAMDPANVRPGFSPLEGSPKENDPTQLANPNNPNSPITTPLNPSNPANMPQTQSEKPASEQRMFMELQKGEAKEIPKTKAQTEAEKERTDLLKSVGEVHKEFGVESSIPAAHPYWGQIARLRVLSNP